MPPLAAAADGPASLVLVEGITTGSDLCLISVVFGLDRRGLSIPASATDLSWWGICIGASPFWPEQYMSLSVCLAFERGAVLRRLACARQVECGRAGPMEYDFRSCFCAIICVILGFEGE